MPANYGCEQARRDLAAYAASGDQTNPSIGLLFHNAVRHMTPTAGHPGCRDCWDYHRQSLRDRANDGRVEPAPTTALVQA